MLSQEGVRNALPSTVSPGQEFTANLVVQAPDMQGNLELRITLVQEGIAWFMLQSGDFARVSVKVVP
jgi:hypothetical protein